MSYFERRLRAQAHALMLPRHLREHVDRYVQRHRAGADPEKAPFPRRLDLWAYSVFAAVALGLEPESEVRARRAGYKFKDTRTVNMSPELCELLAVVAAAGLGPENEQTPEPAGIVRYANRLAAAGCPVVIAELEKISLRLTELEKMAHHAESLLEKVQGKEHQPAAPAGWRSEH